MGRIWVSFILESSFSDGMKGNYFIFGVKLASKNNTTVFFDSVMVSSNDQLTLVIEFCQSIQFHPRIILIILIILKE